MTTEERRKLATEKAIRRMVEAKIKAYDLTDTVEEYLAKCEAKRETERIIALIKRNNSQ